MSYRAGSLFAGIGGIDLGLERAGWTMAWQVENDPWCQSVLRRHWPHMPLYGDVTTLDLNLLTPVDLVAAGFPCQPVSTAGRRKGTEDDRWLWPDTLRVLRHLRPRLVLLENTAGLLTANGGAAFAEVLGGLAAIGYDAEWESLPAAAVGAPHLRYRIFVVGTLADPSGLRRAGSSHPRDGDPSERRTTGNQPSRSRTESQSGTLAHADGPRPFLEEKGEARRRIGSQRQRARIHQSDRRGRHRSTFLAGYFDHRAGRLTGTQPWTTEPDVGRVAHGIPRRVDRLRGLGNAVVPQVAEWIGRRLIVLEET